MILSAFRESKNLSLRDVGEKMGCSHVSVSKLEKAKNPGIRTLERYADAVGVPVSKIVKAFLQSVN